MTRYSRSHYRRRGPRTPFDYLFSVVAILVATSWMYRISTFPSHRFSTPECTVEVGMTPATPTAAAEVSNATPNVELETSPAITRDASEPPTPSLVTSVPTNEPMPFAPATVNQTMQYAGDLPVEMRQESGAPATQSQGLQLLSQTTETSSGDGIATTSVKGVIHNASDHRYSRVQIAFNLKDESGAVVNHLNAVTRDLGPGEDWHFEAAGGIDVGKSAGGIQAEITEFGGDR